MLGEAAGGEWTARARNAAHVIGTGGDDADRVSDQVQLLSDIRDAFGENDAAIFTEDLLRKPNELEDSPWGGRNRGDGITSRDLAAMLRPFRVRSKQIRIGEETRKGYQFDWFEKPFARHLPAPERSEQTKQPKQPHRIAMPMFRMFRMFRTLRRPPTPRSACVRGGSTPMTTEPRLALTRQEAAAAIGCGLSFFEEQVQPDLKVVRRGRKVLVPVAELERWLAKHAEPSVARGRI